MNGESDLPPYTYVSGKRPHPISHPDGHSYGHADVELRSDSEDAARRHFDYGIRLFNAGFYWESHEAWEAIWKVAEDVSHRRRLQALIKLAAAAVKGRELREVGVTRHLRRALELLGQTAAEPTDWMEVDWLALAKCVEQLATNPRSLLVDSDAAVVITTPFEIPRTQGSDSG